PARGKAPAIRTEGDAVDLFEMPSEVQKSSKGVGVPTQRPLVGGGEPELDHSVCTSGGQLLAVGAEGDTVNPLAVSAKAANLSAGSHVPDLHRFVLSG